MKSLNAASVTGESSFSYPGAVSSRQVAVDVGAGVEDGVGLGDD